MEIGTYPALPSHLRDNRHARFAHRGGRRIWGPVPTPTPLQGIAYLNLRPLPRQRTDASGRAIHSRTLARTGNGADGLPQWALWEQSSAAPSSSSSSSSASSSSAPAVSSSTSSSASSSSAPAVSSAVSYFVARLQDLALTEDTSTEDTSTDSAGEEEPPPAEAQALTLQRAAPPDAETQLHFFQRQLLRRQNNPPPAIGPDLPEPEAEPGL